MSKSPLSQLSKLSDLAAGTAGLIKGNNPLANKHQARSAQRAHLIKILKGAGIDAEIPEDPAELDTNDIIKKALSTVPATMLGLAGDKVEQPEMVQKTVESLMPALSDAVTNAVSKKQVNIHRLTAAVVETIDGAKPDSDVAAAFNIINNAFSMVGGPEIDETTEIQASEKPDSLEQGGDDA